MVGKFKDECNGVPIAEFVGLRPKMYSIKKSNKFDFQASGSEIRKAKGVQRAVVKKDLHHEMYKECLFEQKQMRHTQVAIRSRGHEIGVYEQNKISLSPLDTKKWIADDGIVTRAYGHHRIYQEEENIAEEVEEYLNELLT